MSDTLFDPDYRSGRHRYPDWSTSIIGAERIAYRSGSQKEKLLSAYKAAYPAGLTDDEAAVAAGLPQTVLLLEDRSLSTFQNAYYSKEICRQHGFQSVLLVTSTYHSRRARRIFRDIFGSEITVLVQPALRTWGAFCWWFRPDQFRVVLYEYYGWGRYWLGIRLSSEAPPG